MTVERRFPPSVQPGKPKLGDLQPGWKRYRIGDLFEVQNRPVALQDDEQYDLVTVRRSRGGVDFRSRLFGREISVKSQFYIREGDFLISKRQIVHGACGFVPAELDGAIVSNEYSVLRCTKIIDPAYLNQLIHSVYLQQTFFHSSIGVHIEKMIFKLDDWFKWPAKLPPISEQKRIAAFLSAVDDKGYSLSTKKALLEDYKKGCMQKLFSRELRFKDEQGEDFPEWEEETICDAFDWARTNSLSRDKLSHEATGEVQNIHYGDIHTKFGANFHQTDELVPFIKGSSRVDFSESDFCRLGDVVIADASEDYADIGKAIEIVELSETSLVAGLHTYIARPKGKKLALGFSGYLLRSHSMRRQIMRIAQGISVLGVSKGNLEKLTLQLPHTDEQKKIAGFVSSIDRKVDLVAKEINDAKQFKKGLLQGMFM